MSNSTVELGQPVVDVKKPDDDDERYWSVTTIIGTLDKPALVYWSAEETAKAAVAHHDAWRSIEESSGTEEAVRWLTGARFRPNRGELGAAEFGTQVHALCESYALTGTKPTPDPKIFKADLVAAQACLDRFDAWLTEFQPAYQAAEVTIFNRTYGYAGTGDCFFTVDGFRAIGDYKVTKKSYDKQGKPTPLYPEVALQLSAYRFGELAAVWRPRRFESFRRRYYLLSQTERDMGVPVPEVDGGIGIKITPEHCIAYPVVCDTSVWEHFLFTLENARWSFDVSKNVIGEPLIAPERVA